MKMVIVESPYKGDIERNVAYARACIRNCLTRGEAPFASHLLYTQDGVLRDDSPVERKQGIEAGLELAKRADLTAVYIDFGISGGMDWGIFAANECKRPIEYRRLDARVLEAVLSAHPFPPTK